MRDIAIWLTTDHVVGLQHAKGPTFESPNELTVGISLFEQINHAQSTATSGLVYIFKITICKLKSF